MNTKQSPYIKVCNRFYLLVLIVSILFLLPGQALAAKGKTSSKPIEMQDGVTYKKYDITGDGKADRFMMKYVPSSESESGDAECHFYLKGKYIQTINCARGGNAYLLAASSKKVFLFVTSAYFGGESNQVYIYKNKKFKKAYSGSLGEDLFDYVAPVSVSSKKIKVKVIPGKHSQEIFSMDTEPSFSFSYKIKGRKLVLASRTGTVSGQKKYTANLSFSTSKKNTKTKANGPYVKAGSVVRIKKIYIGKAYGDIRFQIQVKKKNCWINQKSISAAGADYENSLLV